jgi:hypothetical protein
MRLTFLPPISLAWRTKPPTKQSPLAATCNRFSNRRTIPDTRSIGKLLFPFHPLPMNIPGGFGYNQSFRFGELHR